MNDCLFRSLGIETRHDRWMSEKFQSNLVSVIVPTFNRSKFLVESIDSVLAQTYRPIELLVIDDGSTDDTAEVLEKWTKQHSCDGEFQVRYLHQENSGAPVARNHGLIESHGEYIQYLDSDDLLHPDKFLTQIGILASDPLFDFVYSGTGYFIKKPDWNTLSFSGVAVSETQMLSIFFNRPIWLAPSGIYSRRACINIGPWDERLERCQDWEYNIRFILNKPHIAYVEKIFSLARFHNEGRITSPLSSEHRIRTVLFANKEVEKMIRAAGRMEKSIECKLSMNYMQLIVAALRLDLTNMAREIAALCSRLLYSPEHKHQIAIWRVLTSLPGWLGSPLARALIASLAAKQKIKRVF